MNKAHVMSKFTGNTLCSLPLRFTRPASEDSVPCEGCFKTSAYLLGRWANQRARQRGVKVPPPARPAPPKPEFIKEGDL